MCVCVCVFHAGTCDRIEPCVLFVGCTCLSPSGLPLLGQQARMTCGSSSAVRRDSRGLTVKHTPAKCFMSSSA